MSIPPENVAAVVVLYEPNADVISNIKSWVNQVSSVYVVDNSDGQNETFVATQQENSRFHYIFNGGNLGVAQGLNIGAKRAIEAGHHYLLTMDQDSHAHPGMVEFLLSCFEVDVGLVAPSLLTLPKQSPQTAQACRLVQTAMTSGSLLNLDVYQKVGPFRDDFFIDFVDIEYCLRLQRHGYRVLQSDGACLEHHVGQRVGPKWFSVTMHPPLRKYYKTRNRFQVWKEYSRECSGYIWRDRVRFVLEFGRLVLCESEKWAKLCMLWRGAQDFRKGRFGKYEG